MTKFTCICGSQNSAKKSLCIDNGPTLARHWPDINPASPRRLLSIILFLLLIGVSNVWGAIASGTYELVTSTSGLTAGSHYIFASGKANGTVYVVANTSKTDNRATVSATVSSQKITVASDASIMTFTLGGDSKNGWTFSTDNYLGTAGLLAAASSSDNRLKILSSPGNDGKWDITFTSDVAKPVAKGTSSRKYMKYNYNNGTPIFNCYSSSGSESVYLYKQATGYSITYHCNDATSGCPSNVNGQTALPNPLPTPTKTGFTFGGWYTNSTLTTAATAGASLAANADLYAKWTCNVTLNRNGATETINDVIYGTALDDIDGSTTQGGCSAWTFVGWSKTQRAAQNNSDAMTLVTTVDGAGPYYAVYSHTESGGTTTKNYSITFDDNGSDSSTDLTTSTFKGEVSSNADSISSVTATTKCYPGNGGIKMSSQKYNGSFTLALAHSLPIKKVVLNAKRGGTGTFANGVTVGSTAFSTSSSYSTTSFVDIEFTGTKTTSNSLTVTSTSGSSEGTSNANRVTWLASITIYYEVSGDVTYYSTTASCCSTLGSINGSFSFDHLLLPVRAGKGRPERAEGICTMHVLVIVYHTIPYIYYVYIP